MTADHVARALALGALTRGQANAAYATKAEVGRGSAKSTGLFMGVAPVAGHTYGPGRDKGQSNGTDTGATTELRHRVTADLADVRLVYGNVGAGNAGPNDINVKASVKLPDGTILPVYFAGKRTVTIAPAGYIVSDPVALPPSIVTGTTIRTRSYVSVTAGQKWYNGVVTANTDNEGVVVGSDLTDSGTVPASFTNAFGPIAIIGATAEPVPSVAIIGDSIAEGQGDGNGPAGWDNGFIQRALYDAGIGYVSVAKPGERADQFVAPAVFARRFPLVAASTDAVIQYGINDVTSGVALATMKTNAITLWQAVVSRQVRAWQTTITPASGASNTTPHVNDATRVGFNDWLRDGAPVDENTLTALAIGEAGALRAGEPGHPLAGYFEVADIAETARNSGLWKPGYATDGTHPITAGTTALKAAIDTSRFTV